MADDPKTSPASPPASAPPAKRDEPEFKIAEIRDDGTAILQMEDGRMFPATVKEGLAIRKHGVVHITQDGEDRGGAPTNAVVVRLVK